MCSTLFDFGFSPPTTTAAPAILESSIKLRKVYRHSFSGKVKFGCLAEDVVYEAFRDGRAASPFLERMLPIWHPELRYVKGGVEHDFVHVNNENIRYEAKSFTQNGMSFAPSHMTGKDRKIDPERFRKCAENMIYICCDVSKFPIVYVVFLDGKELYQRFPKGKLPFRHRQFLFGS